MGVESLTGREVDEARVGRALLAYGGAVVWERGGGEFEAAAMWTRS